MKVVVTVPNDYLGNVTADMNSRRGMIIDTEDRGVVKLVSCEVPLSEMFGYTTSLRGMSQGRASSTMEFLEYRPMPSSMMKEILEAQSGKGKDKK
jgi:elongation factor G